MGTQDARIDDYIARAAPFAHPLLAELRARVHAICPQVEETIKWGMPTYTYAGAILCGMAAFKQHVSFGYWKHALIMGQEARPTGMGSYGKLTSLKDLPSKRTMQAHLKQAMRINIDNIQTSTTRKSISPKPVPQAPDDFKAALASNTHAKAVFDGFPPSAQRDYLEWIAEAKREDTRAKRLAQTVEWLTQGKRRHWKYESC